MIELDGSYGEGGGQILRTALAYSAIFKTPVRIRNIRANRKKPGLGIQHLVGVNAMARISGARIEGNSIGSQIVVFIPQEIRPGDYEFKIETAGSITMILQSIFLPLCLADGESRLMLTGGTHVPWSPPLHYFSEVFLHSLNIMGISAEVLLEKWGFYPRGGGMVRTKIHPTHEIRPISLVERGSLNRIRGISAVGNLPEHIARRQKEQAFKRIRSELKIEPEVEIIDHVSSIGQGSFLLLLAECEGIVAGFSSLGARGKPAEKVADEGVDLLKNYIESEGCVDPHLADQLVPFMGLAKGNSSLTTTEMTEHLLTNIWVIGHFTGRKIQKSGEPGRTGRIDFYPIEG